MEEAAGWMDQLVLRNLREQAQETRKVYVGVDEWAESQEVEEERKQDESLKVEEESKQVESQEDI